ncbi:unnamed protein product [Penicillium crustosum]
MVRGVALVRGDSKITGVVSFEQIDEKSSTTISWDLTGNDPNTQRGFHIHQFGDNTNGCTSAGPHFNPFGRAHGGPGDSERHVGDLGNFKTDRAGNSKGTMQDHFVKLIGLESVLGVRTSSFLWCDRACGRVECFGQAELAEVGLAFPSVNVRHIVAGQGRASVLCLGD